MSEGARHRRYSRADRRIQRAVKCEDAADAADGVTGSFAKELIRRCVLRASRRRMPPTDEDLTQELAALLDTRAQLTRTMLGARPPTQDPAPSIYPGSYGSLGSM